MDNFEQHVRQALRPARVPHEGRHEVDFEAIAAFVDGELAGEEKRLLLAHLERCDSCRQLAMAAGLAVKPRRPWLGRLPFKPMPWRRMGPWLPAWAMAGVAAVLVISLLPLLSPLFSTEPSEREGANNWFSAAPDLNFAVAWDQGSAQIYRNSMPNLIAVPLSPRRSVAESLRPSMYWRGVPADAWQLEIMVIDDAQQLIARWQAEVDTDFSPWPAGQAALAAGKIYAWKLSYWTDEGPQTTVFTPFTTVGTPISATSSAQDMNGQTLVDRLALLIDSGHFGLALQQLLEQAPSADADLSTESGHVLQHELARRLVLSPAELAVLGMRP